MTKVRVFFLFALIINLSSNLISQTALLWSEDFETDLTNYYSDEPILELDDDTIVVHGRKNTLGGQRLLIVRYDLNGDTISTQSYGDDSVSNSVILDYEFAGSDFIYILQKDYLEFYKAKVVLQKYSFDGTLVWAKQIQNAADTSYSPHRLALINDTSIFVTVEKEYNYPDFGGDVVSTITLPYLYSFAANGNLNWKIAFDQNTEISYFPYFSDIIAYNNSIMIFGNNYGTNYCYVKVDLDQTITVVNDLEIENGIGKILITPDNDFLIFSPIKYRITKLAMDGSQIWSTYYGTNLPLSTSGDEIIAVKQDIDNNIYLTGRHYGLGYGTPAYTNADILTLKLDSDGNIIWENRYMFGTNNGDIGNSLVLKNNYVYVGGQSQLAGAGTDSDYLVLKIDAITGAGSTPYRYNGNDDGHDVISSIAVFDDGRVALTGLSFQVSDYGWTTQLLDVNLNLQNIQKDNTIELFPNPVSANQTLTLRNGNYQSYSIVSLDGSIVQKGLLSMDETNSIVVSGISSGVYFINLISTTGINSQRLVIE